MRPTNPNFTKYDDDTFHFLWIRDINVENNLITFETIIYSYKGHCTIGGGVYLTYEINENDIKLIELTGPQ
jgi:hypothetical protein